jgi:hypothetical protein
VQVGPEHSAGPYTVGPRPVAVPDTVTDPAEGRRAGAHRRDAGVIFVPAERGQAQSRVGIDDNLTHGAPTGPSPGGAIKQAQAVGLYAVGPHEAGPQDL